MVAVGAHAGVVERHLQLVHGFQEQPLAFILQVLEGGFLPKEEGWPQPQGLHIAGGEPMFPTPGVSAEMQSPGEGKKKLRLCVIFSLCLLLPGALTSGAVASERLGNGSAAKDACCQARWAELGP